MAITNNHIQLFRNSQVFASRDAAIDKLNKFTSAEVQDGTPVLARYTSGNTTKTLLALFYVNGTAILELRPLGFSTVGVDSPDDLVKTKFGEYGETQKGWTAEDAKGFIKVLSTPLRVFYANHQGDE